jgi:endonuclease/exonuclease/phosphatase family metal-dependent hydrolase
MKIVTWNIQWCRGCDGRVDPGRIVAHARALADFDVLCLQEVAANFDTLPGSSGENQFEVLGSLLPGYTAVAGVAVDTPAPDGSRRRFGNLILSRYPVLQVMRIQLPWPSDPGQKSMPRLLLEATVDTPLGAIRIMTTHLEYYSALQRAAQVEAIRAQHAEACGRARSERKLEHSPGPFQGMKQSASAILTGDFNFRPEDPLHLRLGGPFGDSTPELVDAWPLLHPSTPHAHTSGVHDRAQWPEPFTCDFIFASRDLAPRLETVKVDGDTRASDHQPVLLELS